MISEAKQDEVKQEQPKGERKLTEVYHLDHLCGFDGFARVKTGNGKDANFHYYFSNGMTPEQFHEMFRKFYSGLDMIQRDYEVEFWAGGIGGGKDTPADPSKPAAPDLPSSGNGSTGKKERKWDEPVPQGELPEELAEVTVNVFTQEFDVVKVLPQPDDKATVEFWKDGLKFAVGAKINKGKYETIKQYLAGLNLATPIDPSKAGEYRIAGLQYWTQGNEYEYQGQKKHYKNIALLKPTL